MTNDNPQTWELKTQQDTPPPPPNNTNKPNNHIPFIKEVKLLAYKLFTWNWNEYPPPP